MLPEALAQLCIELLDPPRRAAAVRKLSDFLGIDTFLVFIPDPLTGEHLAAPGFPQTLPGGRQWRTFLEECRSKGRHEAALPWPDAETMRHGTGFVCARGAVLVAVGQPLAPEATRQLGLVLPLMAAALEGEQAVLNQRSEARLNADMLTQLDGLARALDAARQATQRELSARIKAEEQLRELNRTLEQRVAERTASLQESILDMEAFSYTVSHDLRAPLRGIQSFAQILTEDCVQELSPLAKDYLSRIINASARLDRLIQDLLAYSRIRANLPLSPVETEKVVRAVLDSYPALHSARAKVQVTSSLPKLVANESLLTQALANLLSNAAKFVSPGVVPEIRLWAEPSVLSGKAAARILVRDNGIGIPPEQHEKIFGMFDRLSPKYEGTGIGLAMVKKAVERMGGRVGLTSEPGHGSTFWLELQRAEESTDDTARAGQQSISPATTEERHKIQA